MDKITFIQILSYVLDWVILIVVGVVGVILGNITPNKRPFSLYDPNIAFQFAHVETVNSTMLLVCNAIIPIAVILVVTILLVPGQTVPPGTPKSLIWKRKLWELHTGWLGLASALIGAWIITQGMKNLFGKPRPDLLDRCDPDFERWFDHVHGYFMQGGGRQQLENSSYNGQLVNATICRNPDHDILDDGFRSYPSGHSSSAAAGLIYLSLFLASKFVTTFPFVPGDAYAKDGSSTTAFPSRLRNGSGRSSAYEAAPISNQEDEELSYPNDPTVAKNLASHNSHVSSLRRQAAAPPLYLLVITLLPFFTAIFVASSRWFDFRHHGFDILFGFIIGTITAFFAFRYYHMPISSGAGWAWGPRSHDKAFWAGIGSWSFATNKQRWDSPGDVEERLAPPGTRSNDFEMRLRANKSRPENYEQPEESTAYQGARI